MLVAVLGGTGFIGRTIVAELRAHGLDVLVVHRGTTEVPEADGVPHVHVAREALGVSDLRDAEGFVDVRAMTRADADFALGAIPEGIPSVVLSSMDVYHAYTTLMANGPTTDPVPLEEASPVRSVRYPFRGMPEGRGDDYEKLDVEEAFLARGATVLRLPMVYGEHDRQRREWFVLRRIRAGRTRMPIGAGNWLWSKGYVRDIATAVRQALLSDAASGEIFNVCEQRTLTMRHWAERIAAVAGAAMEFVRVPDDVLSEELDLTAAVPQHFVCDGAKARRVLGFAETDPDEALARSVRWHLDNQPAEEFDPTADDAALTATSP